MPHTRDAVDLPRLVSLPGPEQQLEAVHETDKIRRKLSFSLFIFLFFCFMDGIICRNGINALFA